MFFLCFMRHVNVLFCMVRVTLLHPGCGTTSGAMQRSALQLPTMCFGNCLFMILHPINSSFRPRPSPPFPKGDQAQAVSCCHCREALILPPPLQSSAQCVSWWCATWHLATQVWRATRGASGNTRKAKVWTARVIWRAGCLRLPTWALSTAALRPGAGLRHWRDR